MAAVINLGAPDAALALLNSPNAQIPRTVDAALRRAIPALNPGVAKMQQKMEEVAYFLRIPQRKPWASMASNVTACLALLEGRQPLLEGVPPAALAQANADLDTAYTRLKQLELSIKSQQPDAVSTRVAAVLRSVADLEILQAPGLPYSIPKEYAALPRLTGRALVRLTLEHADGGGFVDKEAGGMVPRGVVELTLDGYSAPITAGNFVQNVQQGLYNGTALQASYSSAIFPGRRADPQRPPVPLEFLPAGEFAPVYRLPLDVQSGELPVLPLSISGAVAMTHVAGTDSFVSGQEWFVFKFDKQQAGLGGLSFDEGTFGVFAYVTKGLDVVGSLRNGDSVVEAQVVAGLDKLVVP
jgi:cyclophilin family peptidyl-prolyl cis-trans isomerase